MSLEKLIDRYNIKIRNIENTRKNAKKKFILFRDVSSINQMNLLLEVYNEFINILEGEKFEEERNHLNE